MNIELIVKWKIAEAQVERILGMLPELAEKSRGEAGNLAYAVYQSESNPGEIILHELYRDEEALEAHKNSAHYQDTVVSQIIPHLTQREVTRVRKLL